MQQLVSDDHVVASLQRAIGKHVDHSHQAFLHSVRVRQALQLRRVMKQHEQADLRRSAARDIRRVGGEPTQLQAPPGNRDRASPRLQHGRRLARRGIQLDAYGLLEVTPEALRLLSEESLDVGEVCALEPGEIAPGHRAVIAVDGEEADPQGLAPARGDRAVAPRTHRHDQQDQQQDQYADLFPHRDRRKDVRL